ncbi:class I adenylate-forming enzyme family protein [Labedaea rhizosphaerae]|uniref:Acyl-CoA synthetase (AMP-forming)/AMP-acid ligase II n=1 Tax=Labedaea rhizosphaerae TaxID=598644 RepID=A0A4R6S6P7_LABRH|nr:fatty acid--CoA ligase family protein [Labedaea rhizosphaerae]TDP94994.1 acyl-CoA synthetase (AMP-forming)/AMP-acid ligase II [Labedaea rhizosphaerae]
MGHDNPEPFPSSALDALAEAGHRTVFEHGDRTVTGTEMLDLTARIANGLRGMTIGPGVGIALMLGVNAEALATILAAHVVGARVLGIRPGLPDDQVQHLLSLDNAAVITDAQVEGLTTNPAGSLRPQGKPDDVARLIHTSGSTGMPKAVAQTYAAMTAEWAADPARWPAVIRELAPRLGRHLVFGTLASQVMFQYALLAIGAGGTVVVADPPTMPEAITRLRATSLVSTVPRLAALVAAKRAGADLSTLQGIVVAGSPLSEARHREALDVLGPIVFHGYGQTEAGLIAMTFPTDPPGDVGRAPDDVTVEIRDPDGAAVPDGTEGELFVRTPGQSREYWGDPVRSAEVFTGGWVRTRDLGHRDAEGRLHLTGRARDVVIVNAVVHYAGPIERAITGHPDVAEAYVVGVPDDETGEAVHAFIVPLGDAVPDLAEVRALVIDQLGAGCAPKRMTVIDKPPIAPSGKPDKRLLSSDN